MSMALAFLKSHQTTEPRRMEIRYTDADLMQLDRKEAAELEVMIKAMCLAAREHGLVVVQQRDERTYSTIIKIMRDMDHDASTVMPKQVLTNLEPS